MLRWIYTDLEASLWTSESGPSINPAPPEDFQVQYTGKELQLFLRGAAGVYGGALAKGVQKLPTQSKKMQLSLEVFFCQDLLEFGQVLEMDTKVTDCEGWTYPGDFQLLVPSWQPQIGNPWFNYGEPKTLFAGIWNRIKVAYELDYKNHTIRINNSDPLPAKQEGWAPAEIVSQLQLCSNGQEDYHTVYYNNIAIEGEW